MNKNFKPGDYIYISYTSDSNSLNCVRHIAQIKSFDSVKLCDSFIYIITASIWINHLDELKTDEIIGFCSNDGNIRLATEEEKKYLIRQYKQYKFKNESKI